MKKVKNYQKDCPLCRLVQDGEKFFPELIYEDDLVTITYCKIHTICPMIVLNEHKKEISIIEWKHILQIKDKLFSNTRFRGIGMKRIPNHWHEHLIDK